MVSVFEWSYLQLHKKMYSPSAALVRATMAQTSRDTASILVVEMTLTLITFNKKIQSEK